MFHTDNVKKAAREAVVGKFDRFTPSYYAETSEQNEAWWNRFKTQFKYQKFRKPEIKAGFEEYCSERLRDLVCRAGTGKNTWIEASVFEEMLAYRATEKFKIRSLKYKKNRTSKGKNGKAPGTHTMGRLNNIKFMDKLCNDNGGLLLPPPYELMKKSKTKKIRGLCV
ncbi:uncharacterized protein LOC141626269 isoform X2 [Silene latifolia]|uniref:uncharacterized protein LOC141626269 isoform X2 n=1 Tax=Silene latifolia TaxID=37657 RepID=UPI003D786141